jgi:hypothetical protein
MKKLAGYMFAFFLANIITMSALAQSTVVSGSVVNSLSKETISAVSITVKGGSVGTFTSDKGTFKLAVTQKLPFTLLISSVGFSAQELVVSKDLQSLKVELVPSEALGQEVVVSATKVAQKILESPVSIERVSAANIRNSAVSSYYDILSSLKGLPPAVLVEVVTQELIRS